MLDNNVSLSVCLLLSSLEKLYVEHSQAGNPGGIFGISSSIIDKGQQGSYIIYLELPRELSNTSMGVGPCNFSVNPSPKVFFGYSKLGRTLGPGN